MIAVATFISGGLIGHFHAIMTLDHRIDEIWRDVAIIKARMMGTVPEGSGFNMGPQPEGESTDGP
jgi:hypothetical protein